MRSVAPALLPVFRSHLQADMLAALLLDAGTEYSMTDLARRLGAPLTSVHDEAKRLVAAELLVQRQLGRSVLLRANVNNRLVKPLTELVLLSWGPQHVVAEEFSHLASVEQVLIFGSWAARYHEKAGPPPRDIDVLVVGAPSRDAVYDAADRSERRLAMPVNPVIRNLDAWHDVSDPLLQQIKTAPVVTVLVPGITHARGRGDEI